MVYHIGLCTLNKLACFTLLLPSCDSLSYANERYLSLTIMPLIFAKACKTSWLMLLNVEPMKASLNTATQFHNISSCPLSLLTALCWQLRQMCLATFITAATEKPVTLPHINLKSFSFPQKCVFRITKPSPETRPATVRWTIQLTSFTNFKERCAVVFCTKDECLPCLLLIPPLPPIYGFIYLFLWNLFLAFILKFIIEICWWWNHSFVFFLAFPLVCTNIVHLLNRKNFSITCFLRETHISSQNQNK